MLRAGCFVLLLPAVPFMICSLRWIHLAEISHLDSTMVNRDDFLTIMDPLSKRVNAVSSVIGPNLSHLRFENGDTERSARQFGRIETGPSLTF